MLRKVSRLLKIVREVNLDAIREQAEAPLPTLLVADNDADGEQLVSLLVGPGGPAHPWTWLATPERAGEVVSREAVRLALLVSTSAELSSGLAGARNLLVARQIPVVVVLAGSFGFLDTFARRGEQARVAVPALAADHVAAVAGKLFDAVPPDRRIALARQFPGLRQPLFGQIIDETSRANATYAFSTGLAEIVPLLDVPLNVGDIVILTKNQLIMAYRLALTAGKEGRPVDVMAELLAVVGGSLLFRQIARELIGLVPLVGIVPKVAVAYGGTWALGRAVVAWATGAEAATRRSLKHLYNAGLDRGREVARQSHVALPRGIDRRRASARHFAAAHLQLQYRSVLVEADAAVAGLRGRVRRRHVQDDRVAPARVQLLDHRARARRPVSPAPCIRHRDDVAQARDATCRRVDVGAGNRHEPLSLEASVVDPVVQLSRVEEVPGVGLVNLEHLLDRERRVEAPHVVTPCGRPEVGPIERPDRHQIAVDNLECARERRFVLRRQFQVAIRFSCAPSFPSTPVRGPASHAPGFSPGPTRPERLRDDRSDPLHVPEAQNDRLGEGVEDQHHRDRRAIASGDEPASLFEKGRLEVAEQVRTAHAIALEQSSQARHVPRFVHVDRHGVTRIITTSCGGTVAVKVPFTRPMSFFAHRSRTIGSLS